jgi:hypothetical protein
LSLPIHPYLRQDEIEKIINTIIILIEQDKNDFIKNIQSLIGDDMFDKGLLTETTEPIYDYIIEKIYLTPEYAKQVEFKSKQKLKIAFNKFYENAR